MSWLSKFFTGTIDRPSPSDITPARNLIKGLGHVLIDLHNLAIPFTETPQVWMPYVPDTNSMDGVYDYGHNVIYVSGTTDRDQRTMLDWLWAQPVGNIIVYRIPNKIYATHRIIKKGKDSSGRYYILKGDNNPTSDPYRVREQHIEWLAIGVIY